ncbi:hypothetical protein NIES4071_08790 [Calothrix sp. NIES-4071]|nr:hypothetical protein NIES4071_08790 [Calothrix sp. NIES-4071]BAZ55221.1 hypothetical protein NIES4105_08750 [Calothrix sp. NIES-4105]
MTNRFITKALSVLGVASTIFAFSGLEANANEVQRANNSAKSGKAADLLTQTYPQAPNEFQQTPVQPTPTQTPVETPAQAPFVSPGRATRGGSSYIGVGGNLGIAGETTLSEGYECCHQ